MPKIFLLKNRLHQQQLKLLEAQNGTTAKNELLDDSQPLSLIVNKKEDAIDPSTEVKEAGNRKREPSRDAIDPSTEVKEAGNRKREPSRDRDRITEDPPEESSSSTPPRRFFSSILGGDVPYGSRGHVLTRAERKEYAPIVPPDKEKVTLPPAKKPPEENPKPSATVPVRQFSVIQRTPKPTKKEEDTDVGSPVTPLVVHEPEQEQPIDYHVPKRKEETENDEAEKRIREQWRSHCQKIGKQLLLIRNSGKLPPTTSAAAGHGRSSSGGQGSVNQSANSSSSGGGGGGTINFSGGSSGGSSGGALGGGTGGGGPGRDGRQNYGPSSPQSGSLPPFYESLKGGNNGNNYNANGNFTSNFLLGNQNHMQCDTGQELANLSLNGRQSPPKQYSTLQNASYGIVMKDEGGDLDIYEAKLEAMSQLLPGAYTNYDDSIMADMVHGGIDPLHFTNTLNFSNSADNALLESLSDAADLSTFLQRLPNEDNDSEEIISHSPSITPESSQIQQVDQNLEPFNEQQILNNRNYENRSYGSQSFTKMYDNLPSYQSSISSDHLQVQMHLQQPGQQAQQILSPALSFNGSGLDLDSPTTMSLPSPGAASCSLDGPHNDGGSTSPPANVSGRRASSSTSGSETSALHGGRVNVLQHRLGLSSEVQLEFVNGGAGIKNPLASQDTVRQGPRTEDKTKVAAITTEDGQTNFCCKICNKTFALQRLLNRHMKCHSDVKRYLCTFCGKGFNDTFDLKRHTRTHTGVRPYKCSLCEKSFTQRCSLESHCLKVHGVQHQYAYKERRTKVYVCEECGHTTNEPEVHYLHLKEKHPYSPALLKFYDKRHFKFTNSNFANMLLQ